jgi:endogenous inhibitor of DNA gyrase (YacG/DUF329 family)
MDFNQRSFPCPHCGQPSTWQANLYRPFCTERCKLIDLGAWANEDYKIASAESSPSLASAALDQDE